MAEQAGEANQMLTQPTSPSFSVGIGEPRTEGAGDAAARNVDENARPLRKGMWGLLMSCPGQVRGTRSPLREVS